MKKERCLSVLRQLTSMEMTGEELLRVLRDALPDYSRAAQFIATILPEHKSALKNLSEKELYLISREANIQAMMKSTGLTREEAEKMLGNPF